MMKAAVGMLVLAVGGIAAFYYFGGYGSFDPTAQGKEALQKIEDAMKKGAITYKDVIKIAGNPQSYRYYQEKQAGGEKMVVPGPELQNFDRATLDADFKDKKTRLGFDFMYTFSGSMRFVVQMDGTGRVGGVAEDETMKRLFGN